MKATFDKSGKEFKITPQKLVDVNDLSQLTQMSVSTNEATPCQDIICISKEEAKT